MILRKRLILLLLISLSLCLYPAAAQAAIPETINFQGVLLDSGQPVSGNHEVLFTLYKYKINDYVEVGWSETQAVMLDDAGFFNVELGKVQPFSNVSGLDFSVPYYIKIVVDPNGGMPIAFTEYQPLLSVPYAKFTEGVRLKPVDVTTVPHETGRMVFDSVTQRVMYYDGTQWVQIDPAYTSQDIISSTPLNQAGILSTSIAEFNIGGISNVDIIVTGISGWIEKNIVGTYKLTLTHQDGTHPHATFYVTTRSQLGVGAGSSAGNGNFHLPFPVPVKYDGGKNLKVTVEYVGSAAPFNYSITGLTVQYIRLPL